LLVTHLHLAADPTMRREPPFADDVGPGIFATRGPRRPNPIGISRVRLTDVSAAVLSVEDRRPVDQVEDRDLVDGTPVLDVKPFAPKPEELEGLGGIERETDTSYALFRSERG
jgi:tRNA (Thr-GGU) A37 N-methylase